MGNTEDLLSIDSSALTAAAESYKTAAKSYSEALSKIIADLQDVLNVWDDSSKEIWTQKVENAKANLGKVGNRMSSNASILSQIATAAEITESNVKTGISSL